MRSQETKKKKKKKNVLQMYSTLLNTTDWNKCFAEVYLKKKAILLSSTLFVCNSYLYNCKCAV